MHRMNIFTITLSIVISTTISLSAQENGGGYDWPLKPGMPEWKELTTHNQMTEALLIPEEVLSAMSTGALVQTCLNYPLFPDMYASNSLQQGVESILSQCNGFQELRNRPDASAELLKEYTNISITDYQDDRPPFQLRIRLSAIEMLMAQEDFLGNLRDAERLVLLAESVKHFESMVDHLEYYNFMNFDPNAYLIGKVVQQMDAAQFNRNLEQDDSLNNFMQYASNAPANVINKIVTMARELLTQ